MSKVLYNIFLFAYKAGIGLAALVNAKARRWVDGRRKQQISIAEDNVTQKVWMHCASLGEFEQGRPLLEALRNQHPKIKIIITFFSPSGYEICKNYKGADYIFYLPMDNIFAAKKFIDTINPSLVLWVKYEYWFYYLQELKERKIPVLLVSGIFRPSQSFFKWYGGIWRNMLECFTHIFVQNEASKKLLGAINLAQNITICGDTRFDRVITIAQQQLNNPIIEAFCSNTKVIVAGSTWEDDEIILAAYADETHHEYKMIIVPHELDAPHLSDVKKMFKESVFYTHVEKDPDMLEKIGGHKVLIVDTIGILSQLYSFGFINYVGGGFTNDGIHNILEAAVWGKPIIIGENYEKYFEAVELIACEVAQSISDTNELREVVEDWTKDSIYYNESCAAAKNYVYKNVGATQKIISYIEENRLLTS